MTLASLLNPNMPTGEPKPGSVIYDKFGGANLWGGNKPPLPPPSHEGTPPGGFLNDPGFGGENAAVGPGHPDYEESTMTALPKIKPRPGMPDPINTPYQRNEDLDLTNRANVMQEYKNWRMGGHGSRAHTMDMRGGMQFMGEEMAPGSSTGFGDFRKFLGTYGIGDRLQVDPGQLLTQSPVGGMKQQVQPQIGAGLTGLAAYQSQNKGMV